MSRPREMSAARGLVGQLARFAVVGGLGFVLDTAVFDLLRLTVLSPQHLHDGPILAKIASTTVAIAANWIGNRSWTFADSRRARSGGEALEFLVASLIGMGVSLLCLWISHYGLRLTSTLDDTVSANGVGLVLGSAVRFWLYRVWVYRPDRAARREAATAE
ncbi:MAG TPA: GtrA family protein [Amnibacterium sp.]